MHIVFSSLGACVGLSAVVPIGYRTRLPFAVSARHGLYRRLSLGSPASPETIRREHGELALRRFLTSLLCGIKPTNPLTFISVSLILIAVEFVAYYIPRLPPKSIPWPQAELDVANRQQDLQLIQDLVSERVHAVKTYEPTMDKVMRMHSVTSTIENGFVHIPEKAAWLPEFLHELATFPKGTYDDHVDSTSQALDVFKQRSRYDHCGLFEYWKQEAEKVRAGKGRSFGRSFR